jgi:hypothetical protein
VRWLETVVVGVVVYRETDSPFLVSVVTMLRLLPMGLFGAFLGAFVERFDRRRMLAVTGPLGFLWLGWLANQIGAPAATAVTGALGLALLLALRPFWRTV